jgi:ABC-type transport system involved in cytochrome c biogenesis permease subunit
MINPIFITIAIIISTILYGISFSLIFLRKSNKLALYLAIASHFIALVLRSIYAKHPPITNAYETILLFPFLISLRLIFGKKQIPHAMRKWIILAILAFNIFALALPASLKVARPLMPALNSFWMYIHVPAYFIGYVSVLISFIYAVVLFIFHEKMNEKIRKELVGKMDDEVKIAFYFLNVGLITGAIWAYFSWGDYWSWDPKETWALINILILSLYFHPAKKPMSINKKAMIVIITFLTVIFTYWGVSYLLSGLHSYG